MSDGFWQKVDDIYQAALEHSPDSRAAFLDGACKGNVELRQEVESLLQFDGRSTRFIDMPAIELEAKAVAKESSEAQADLPKEFGPYRILSTLGHGGMGEVYRARDSRLNRDVAIKILPKIFLLDRDRLARFQREAQVLASLNHPNIGAIYGLEEQNGLRGLVLELIEGPTLAEQIANGPMALEEALVIARQIAEALEAAHERGVIHRDLKPSNVKVTQDGVVKVLDFGLAKVLGGEMLPEDISNSPTLKATAAGVILGTAAYMSPEQAKAKPVDKRADIWAFGCVLFEMLSGKKLFAGETLTDTLAAVVRAEPNWNDLPASTPPRIHQLLRRCLTKDPRQRLRDIGDAKYDLENADQRAHITGKSRRNWLLIPIVGLLMIAALAVGAFISSRLNQRAETAPPVIRLTYDLKGHQFDPGTNRNRIAISPDGSKLVYIADNKLYLRSLDSLEEAKEIPGGEPARNTFFSPDGQWIAYLTQVAVKKLRVTGGTPVFICSRGDTLGGSWGPDNTILLGALFSGILRVSADGGNPETIVKPAPGLLYANPQFLPDGRSFVYQRGRPGLPADNELVMRTLASSDETVIMRGGLGFRYVPSGHIVYATNRNLDQVDLAVVAFDVNSRQVTSSPTTVITNVQLSLSGNTPQFSVSQNGSLIYIQGPAAQSAGNRLVTVSASGKVSSLAAQPRDYSDPRVSPDGRFVAAHLQGEQNDVWVTDVSRGTLVRLSLDAGEDETPVWSPDGRSVAWAGSRADVLRGIFRRPADGSGSEELVWKLEKHAHVRDWTPDGRALVLEIVDPYTNNDIWRLNLEGTPSAVPFRQTQFNEGSSRLSPDGHWLAYVSAESGRDEIYIQSFPQPGAMTQVSTTGGSQPVWSRDGRKLFFRAEGAIQEITFEPGSPPSVSKARRLFDDTFDSPQGALGGHTAYDVFNDGQFLMIQPVDKVDRGQIVVVVNWIEELKRLVPRGKD